MTRGLTRADAERLIVRGFFQDVLDRIELEPVRVALGEALEARIPQIAMRRLLAAGAVLLALVAAPAAGAWTKLTGDTLQNIVDPSVVVLPNTGTELIAYREPVAGNLKVIRGNNTITLASGLPFVGDAQILYTGGDTLLLYAGEGTGVVPYGSTDDGSHLDRAESRFPARRPATSRPPRSCPPARSSRRTAPASSTSSTASPAGSR